MAKKPATTVSPKKFPTEIREFWETLEWNSLSRFFDNRTITRGRDYADDGCVTSLWVTDDGAGLLATVDGTHEYTVGVTLRRYGAGRYELESSCSCPVECDCKHGLAAICHFLQLLAANKTFPRCVNLECDLWQIFDKNGSKQEVEIVYDEYSMIDDDGDDDDDDYQRRPSKPLPPAKKAMMPAPLKKRLENLSAKDLLALLTDVYESYEDVREHFRQAEFLETAKSAGDVNKLVKEAKKLIDNLFDRCENCGYNGHLYGDPTPDMSAVLNLVRQFAKLDAPLAVIAPVAWHYFDRCTEYVESTDIEVTDDLDEILDEMVEVLLASNTPPVETLCLAYDLSRKSDYCIGENALDKILHHPWPKEVWSAAADTLCALREGMEEREHVNFLATRHAVEALDKAGRQAEATDFLRKNSSGDYEIHMFVDRLIDLDALDEAMEVMARHPKGRWSRPQEKIAEKRKDAPMLVSIRAVEFFQRPEMRTLETLLATASEAGVEPEVRAAAEKFLAAGTYPAAVVKHLAGKKPTAADKKRWPLPFLAFSAGTTKKVHYDLLCEWAVEEKRLEDVIRWYDAWQKQPPRFRRETRQEEKAGDAVAGKYPDRAMAIYRDLAGHEMEITRDYPAAIRLLRKTRDLLRTLDRSAEWEKLLADVRVVHKRKINLMKLLSELEAGPIVQQKRKNNSRKRK